MDKYEYNLRIEQIRDLLTVGRYKQASKVADEIDWRRIKDREDLNLAANVYEAAKEYRQAKEVLLNAYARIKSGRQIAYRLCLISARLKEFEDAEDYYGDFVTITKDRDNSKYILQYEIAKSNGASHDKLIEILEVYMKDDLDEKWSYKLAKLYAESGYNERCVALCNDISLWFNNGKYVNKARELRNQLVPAKERELDVNEIEVNANVNEVYDTINVQAELAKSMDILIQNGVELNREFQTPEETKVVQHIKNVDLNHSEVAVAQESDDKDVEIEYKIEELKSPKVENNEVSEAEYEEWKPEEVIAQNKQPEQVIDSMFKLEGDGQIGLDLPEEDMLEKQITGQLSIDEILKQLEERGVLKASTVSATSDFVKEITGVLPDLNILEDEIEEDETQSKLNVDNDGNLQVEDASEAVNVLDEFNEEVFELVAEDLKTEEEIAREAAQNQRFVDETDEVLKLVEALETDDQEETTEQFDIPDTPQTERYYLSDEHKEVFTKFVGITGLEHSLAKTMHNLIEDYDKDGTSKKNNVIIMGAMKSGKTTLALDIIREVNKARGRIGRKVAKVNGNIINKKGILTAMPKLLGSDLIIEDAGVINSVMLKQMFETFKGYTDEMIIVLEDSKITMERMLEAYPMMENMFENKLIIKEYDINEWAAYAKAYAREEGYIVDEMGTLALYARIDEKYGVNQGLEKLDVEEVVDLAISNSEKRGIGKILGILKKSNDSGYNILKENDFN